MEEEIKEEMKKFDITQEKMKKSEELMNAQHNGEEIAYCVSTRHHIRIICRFIAEGNIDEFCGARLIEKIMKDIEKEMKYIKNGIGCF